jgi:hypothetical protein
VTEVFLNLTEVFLTLTEVLRCFFLCCKANARVKLAETGHGPHSTTLVCICVVRMSLFVSFGCYLCCSMQCLCVNVYRHRVTTQLQLINISYHIYNRSRSFDASPRDFYISGTLKQPPTCYTHSHSMVICRRLYYSERQLPKEFFADRICQLVHQSNSQP